MCQGARSTHLPHSFVLLSTTMQTPHLFISPFPLSSANKSPSSPPPPPPPLDFLLPSPPSSHLYNTVKYLPFCICLTSLLCSLCICLLCCEPCCTKTGRHAGEGLTSSITPITSFFPPSSFLCPLYLLSGCMYVRPSAGKAQQVWKNSNRRLKSSKDR